MALLACRLSSALRKVIALLAVWIAGITTPVSCGTLGFLAIRGSSVDVDAGHGHWMQLVDDNWQLMDNVSGLHTPNKSFLKGRFRAPLSGLYFVTATVRIHGLTGLFKFNVQTLNRIKDLTYWSEQSTPEMPLRTFRLMGTLHLDAADVVVCAFSAIAQSSFSIDQGSVFAAEYIGNYALRQDNHFTSARSEFDLVNNSRLHHLKHTATLRPATSESRARHQDWTVRYSSSSPNALRVSACGATSVSGRHSGRGLCYDEHYEAVGLSVNSSRPFVANKNLESSVANPSQDPSSVQEEALAGTGRDSDHSKADVFSLDKVGDVKSTILNNETSYHNADDLQFQRVALSVDQNSNLSKPDNSSAPDLQAGVISTAMQTPDAVRMVDGGDDDMNNSTTGRDVPQIPVVVLMRTRQGSSRWSTVGSTAASRAKRRNWMVYVAIGVSAGTALGIILFIVGVTLQRMRAACLKRVCLEQKAAKFGGAHPACVSGVQQAECGTPSTRRAVHTAEKSPWRGRANLPINEELEDLAFEAYQHSRKFVPGPGISV